VSVHVVVSWLSEQENVPPQCALDAHSRFCIDVLGLDRLRSQTQHEK